MRIKITRLILIGAICLLTVMGSFNFANHIVNFTPINSYKQIHKATPYFPIESFVMVSQNMATFDELCDEEGNNCLPVPVLQDKISGTGSGVIVGERDGKSLVLTAGHVCNGTESIVPATDTLTMQYDMTLVSGYGKEGIGTIISLDLANDLCLVISDTYLGPSLSVSNVEPELHEKIYTMSSPLGLAAPLAVPIFDGYFAGEVSTLYIFTVPAAPGSSGSPILNSDGEIISIVSAAAISFDEYAIGCKTQAVNNFLISAGVL